MTAADSAPAVDPAPVLEVVEEIKVDVKPVKATKEKKVKAPKEKKVKEVKPAKAPKAPKPPASHPSYLTVCSFLLLPHETVCVKRYGTLSHRDSWRSCS